MEYLLSIEIYENSEFPEITPEDEYIRIFTFWIYINNKLAIFIEILSKLVNECLTIFKLNINK